MKLEVGCKVKRYLSLDVVLQLEITALTKDRIICGDWEFCRKTGAEIDEVLGWGPPPAEGTGSFIDLEEIEDED